MTQLVVAFGSLAILATMGQRGTVPLGPPTAAERQLDDRVATGELAAIREAERSGNKRYVASLIAVLRDAAPDSGRPPAPIATVSAARTALVALIATDQMQAMVCNAVKDDSLMPVRDSFRIVGGWFGIQSLRMMLRPEAEERWSKAVAKLERGSDVTYAPPKFFALQYLQDLAPNPPIRLHMGAASWPEMDAAAKVWLDWIPAHAQELAQLKPTGEGVVFTKEVCR